MRPETGPMAFGDDWRGVFIRGDNACAYASHLRVLMDSNATPLQRELAAVFVRWLADTLASADERTPAEVQRMLPFEACAENDTPR